MTTSPVFVPSPRGKRPKQQEIDWQVITKKKNDKPRKNAETVAAVPVVAPAPIGEAKTKKRRRQPKTRTTAVLLKPTKDASYENVLASIRASVRPEETGAEIKSIRRTRQGEVLLELSSTTKAGGKASFSEAVRGAVGQTG